MSRLIDMIDSGWIGVAAYGIVAVIAVQWGLRERRALADHRLDWWPTYWFTSAALLVTMGLARATDVGGLVADFGREQARHEGWYDTRRTFQALAVAAVAATWLIGILVAIWRIPLRRRRYLRHVIALSTLIGFAAVRIISLHHIDSLLYRTDIGGVRIVSIVELTLLVVTAVAGVGARFDRSTPPEHEAGPAMSDVAREPHGSPSRRHATTIDASRSSD